MELDPKKQSRLNTKLDQGTVNKTNTDKTKAESENKKEIFGNTIRRVRTYKEDIAEAVRSQKASLTSVTAAEQRRRANVSGYITQRNKRGINYKKIGIVFGSLAFIIIGIGIIGFFVFFYEKEEVVTQQEIPSFILSKNSWRLE